MGETDAVIIATGAGTASLAVRWLGAAVAFYVLCPRLRAPWPDAFDERGAGSLRPERGRPPGVGRS